MGDLSKKILFVLLILIVYRIGIQIPVPIFNLELTNYNISKNDNIFSLFNLFSGGALSNFSIFSLGIMPYISASIIIHLSTTVIPYLKKIKKEGEIGKEKIISITRFMTLILSIFQSIVMSNLIIKETSYISTVQYISIILTLTSGTMLLMWLGEQINEHGIGNGASLIIFTSIISNIPKTIINLMENIRQGNFSIIYIIISMMLIFLSLIFIIIIENSQKKIIINYAQRQKGRKLYQVPPTYLPLKINMAGVIPTIFASSIILFPFTIVEWLNNYFSINFLYHIKNLLSPGTGFYIIIFSILIIFFCFFYVNITFDSKETANNLRKTNGFITGIRPGEQTSIYIEKIKFKLTIISSIYLVIISIIPEILNIYFNIPFYFGGTSLLITVVVIIDFYYQIQNNIISSKYNKMINKYKL